MSRVRLLCALECEHYFIFACVTNTHIYTRSLGVAAFIPCSIRGRRSEIYSSGETNGDDKLVDSALFIDLRGKMNF